MIEFKDLEFKFAQKVFGLDVIQEILNQFEDNSELMEDW